MIKAVIFDMFETLVCLFEGRTYFSENIAEDIGIPVVSRVLFFFLKWKVPARLLQVSPERYRRPTNPFASCLRQPD